jgi:hypothetical protein
MKPRGLRALMVLVLGGLLIAGCATTASLPANEIPLTSDALAGHWKAEVYVHTIDLKLHPDGTFAMTLFTFDIQDDQLKGDWILAPANRLVLTFRESQRHAYGFPFQYVRLVEEFTGRSFSLRRIKTFFNPLEFVRVDPP